MMTHAELNEAAHDKVFAKLTQLNRELGSILRDIETDTTCGLDADQMQVLYTSTYRQAEIYNYIAKLIETNK